MDAYVKELEAAQAAQLAKKQQQYANFQTIKSEEKPGMVFKPNGNLTKLSTPVNNRNSSINSNNFFEKPFMNQVKSSDRQSYLQGNLFTDQRAY
jgi:hypothetical protein